MLHIFYRILDARAAGEPRAAESRLRQATPVDGGRPGARGWGWGAFPPGPLWERAGRPSAPPPLAVPCPSLRGALPFRARGGGRRSGVHRSPAWLPPGGPRRQLCPGEAPEPPGSTSPNEWAPLRSAGEPAPGRMEPAASGRKSPLEEACGRDWLAGGPAGGEGRGGGAFTHFPSGSRPAGLPRGAPGPRRGSRGPLPAGEHAASLPGEPSTLCVVLYFVSLCCFFYCLFITLPWP